MNIAVAIFHNIPQIISFKHGPCPFLGISGTMRNTKSHSEFMDRETPHNTCVDCYMETPEKRWVPESADSTPSQPLELARGT